MQVSSDQYFSFFTFSLKEVIIAQVPFVERTQLKSSVFQIINDQKKALNGTVVNRIDIFAWRVLCKNVYSHFKKRKEIKQPHHNFNRSKYFHFLIAPIEGFRTLIG